MKVRLIIFGVIVICATLFLVSSAAEKKKGGSRRGVADPLAKKVQSERTQLNDAKQKLKLAQKAANTAQAHLERAEQQRQVAAKHLQEVRDTLEQKLDGTMGVTDAQDAFNKLNEEYERICTPIRERVRKQPDYVEAVEAADAAKNELAALRDDAEPTSDTPNNRVQELNRIVMAPSGIEQAAIQAAPRVQAFRKRMDKAQSAIAAAIARRDKAIQRDTSYRNATKSFEQAKASVEKAKAELERKIKSVVAAGGKATREQQQLLQATRRQQLAPKRVNHRGKKHRSRRK